MKSSHQPTENELFERFERAASREFAFLGSDGFRDPVIERTPTSSIVRYGSQTRYVDILFGRPEFSPEVVFGRYCDGSHYSCGDLILLGYQPPPPATGLGDRHSEKWFSHSLRWWADWLRGSGRGVLLNDPELFESLERLRDPAGPENAKAGNNE